jgi:hypothetical protein
MTIATVPQANRSSATIRIATGFHGAAGSVVWSRWDGGAARPVAVRRRDDTRIPIFGALCGRVGVYVAAQLGQVTWAPASGSTLEHNVVPQRGHTGRALFILGPPN